MSPTCVTLRVSLSRRDPCITLVCHPPCVTLTLLRAERPVSPWGRWRDSCHPGDSGETLSRTFHRQRDCPLDLPPAERLSPEASTGGETLPWSFGGVTLPSLVRAESVTLVRAERLVRETSAGAMRCVVKMGGTHIVVE